MRKIFTAFILCLLMGIILCACESSPDVDRPSTPAPDTVTTKTDGESTQEGSTENGEETLSREKKIEILKYLHALEDKIYARESEYSDAQLDSMLDEAWEKTCRMFDVTEQDILNIMSDTNLVRESYR